MKSLAVLVVLLAVFSLVRAIRTTVTPGGGYASLAKNYDTRRRGTLTKVTPGGDYVSLEEDDDDDDTRRRGTLTKVTPGGDYVSLEEDDDDYDDTRRRGTLTKVTPGGDYVSLEEDDDDDDDDTRRRGTLTKVTPGGGYVSLTGEDTHRGGGTLTKVTPGGGYVSLPEEDKNVKRHEIDISEAPYQVSLQRNGRHFCGGAILSKKFIITAASCVYNVDRLIKVHAGIGDLSVKGQSVRVVRINIYPDYDAESHSSDLAILQVAPSLKLGRRRKAMRVKLYNPKHPVPSGTSVAISGWSENEDGIKPDVLQQITCNTISWKDNCKSKFNVSRPLLCLESCQGELGDPVIGKSGKYANYLIGLVIFGPAECTFATAGVYMFIGREIRTWIENVTGL